MEFNMRRPGILMQLETAGETFRLPAQLCDDRLSRPVARIKPDAPK
jgi:hypothetical protein